MKMQGIDAITKEITRARTVYVCGNGGAAALASHFVCDLLRLTRVRAFSLVDNAPLMTMIANDYGYEQVFSYQVERLAGAGDLLIAISTSGESPNVLRAAVVAQSVGARVLAITGDAESSLTGPANSVYVIVGAVMAAEIEEQMQQALHAACERLRVE